MARPRKSEHTKQALLEIGMQQLTEHGYHGTGIKQILDAANVPKGSFYNFFESKEHFVAEIIGCYGKLVSAEFEGISREFNQQPAIARLWLNFHQKVLLRIEKCDTCACLIGVMSAEIAQSSGLCRQAISAIEADWVAAIAVLITRGQMAGDILNEISAENLAASFYNSWQGSLLEYQVCDNPNIVLQRLHTFISLLATPSGKQTLHSVASFSKEITYV